MKLVDTPYEKRLISSGYNFYFNKISGLFARWGDTMESDGDLEKGLPEIADIEISTVCHGVGGLCKICYKANSGKGENMSLETFDKIIKKLPPTVTQIAFGIGDIGANKDLWKIMDLTRKQGIIPNITVNGEGITNNIADKLAKVCGAVAVSVYDNEKTYNTIKKLTDRNMKQVNIHFMISKQTYKKAFELIDDIITDKRLEKLNALVFLSLKTKGRGKNFQCLSQKEFACLVDYAMNRKVSIGFDSCSAQKFLTAIKDAPYFKQLEQCAEPCESSLYSTYINVKGYYFPCSFMEGEEGWQKGIDVIKSDNFLSDVWNNKRNKEFRKNVITCRNIGKSCPHYKI